MEKLKLIVNQVIKVLSISILLFCLCYFLCIIPPKIWGIETGVVKSGSMEPAIPTGSMVYIKRQSLDNMKKGNVIAFSLGETTVIHRIVDLAEDGKGYITKGDNNEKEDIAPVTFGQVRGKVIFHIPLLGYIHMWLQRYKLSIVLGVFFGCGMYFLLKQIRIICHKRKL